METEPTLSVPLDPVCRRPVEPGAAASLTNYQGTPRYFCSDVCRAVFDAHPEAFLNSAPPVPVTLPDGLVLQVATGTPIGTLYQSDEAIQPALARCDNDVVDLWAPVTGPCRIDWIPLNSMDGQAAFTRTLLFILIRACAERFPHLTVRLQHSLASQYYCEAAGSPLLHLEDMMMLEKHMRHIVDLNEPIVVHDFGADEAIAILRRDGPRDVIAAVERMAPNPVRLHRLGRYWNLFYGPLLPSAGLAGPFGLHPYPPGFILRFPTFPDMDKLPPFVDQPRLFSVFHEYERWTSAMQAGDLPSLNSAIQRGEGSDLIKITESLHEKRIAAIADEISERRLARVILVAGPSASGKTTFTKRLDIHLRVNGLHPVRIELDHYFREAGTGPRDERGELDFEHIDAVDVPLFNQHLLDLVAGRTVELPYYDFKTGKRGSRGETMHLGPEQILLVEGIHGLNDDLTPTVPRSMKYKIYVSALTHLNLDNHNRISTHDVRLLRRILRDARDRGYSPADTLKRWPSVVLGEQRWIFPYQEGADVMLNSALVYEMPVLAPFLQLLLKTVDRSEPEFAHAAYLLRFLSLFEPLDPAEVPPTSILREFVGGSSFKY